VACHPAGHGRWEKRIDTNRPMTPSRVRRGFRMLRRHLGTPARTPKPTTAGPGRPSGSTRPPRNRYDVGRRKSTVDTEKTTKRQAKG
jgi:hypothetical protein